MDDIDIITETITGVSRGYLLAHPDYDFPPEVRRSLIDALRRYRARGDPFAAHDADGAFVGYMGIHTDGSMGMLAVFPDYRRLGYAEELERFILSKILAEGRTPFCQIAPDNAASLTLQQKLGLTQAPDYVWYIH